MMMQSQSDFGRVPQDLVAFATPDTARLKGWYISPVLTGLVIGTLAASILL